MPQANEDIFVVLLGRGQYLRFFQCNETFQQGRLYIGSLLIPSALLTHF